MKVDSYEPGKNSRKNGPQKSQEFSDDEKQAMKEQVKELKAEARRSARAKKDNEEGESDVLAKIAKLPESDRSMAMRIHEIIKANALELSAKTWCGMPAYAGDGKIVSFFQSAQKFYTRYATLGFSEAAHLDEGGMWSVA